MYGYIYRQFEDDGDAPRMSWVPNILLKPSIIGCYISYFIHLRRLVVILECIFDVTPRNAHIEVRTHSIIVIEFD